MQITVTTVVHILPSRHSGVDRRSFTLERTVTVGDNPASVPQEASRVLNEVAETLARDVTALPRPRR